MVHGLWLCQILDWIMSWLHVIPHCHFKAILFLQYFQSQVAFEMGNYILDENLLERSTHVCSQIGKWALCLLSLLFLLKEINKQPCTDSRRILLRFLSSLPMWGIALFQYFTVLWRARKKINVILTHKWQFSIISNFTQ